MINCDTEYIMLANSAMKDACQVCRDNDVTCGDASHLELSEPSQVDIDIFAPEYELSWSVTEELNATGHSRM